MDPEKVIAAVKAWLTPFLLIAFATVAYDDITEMKSDIKQLLAQSSADAVKIEYLEVEVEKLRNKVYTTNRPLDNKNENDFPPIELLAILPSKDDSGATRKLYYTEL